MTRFQLIKNSREDSCSTTGHAAPSWHTFDKKVWERETPEGTHRVTLTKGKPGGKPWRETYIVTLEREGHDPQEFRGASWQPLVREVKQLSKTFA